MRSKTIPLSDEAYARLKAMKRKGESFSDVINRLIGRRHLSELAGVFSDEDGEILEEAIASLRERSRERMRSVVEEMSN